MQNLTRKIAATPFARAVALPLRLATVARYDARLLRRSGSWLVRSREHSCFTYELEPSNHEHLCWFVSEVTGAPVKAVRAHVQEAEEDADLRRILNEGLATSVRSGTCDREVRYGRRVAYYAFVRTLAPGHVVEAGPHRGIASSLIAAALLRNGSGRLTTVDVDPRAGELIRGPYRGVVDQVVGDSVQVLGSPRIQERGVDMVLLDTSVGPDHEDAELAAVGPALSEHALVLSSRSHAWPCLARWSEERQRRFLHFDDRPRDHWHPGNGFGVSFPDRVRRG
ncbi:class I SAM-dependent methyltransferase [Streptomyces sp. NPDC056632]|uniref:class I SAM-dependent methyltransferase n=1 Tax=Streptomyces sp. NPDC056632 TaxID=3345884 RepID=UPI003682ABB8